MNLMALFKPTIIFQLSSIMLGMLVAYAFTFIIRRVLKQKFLAFPYAEKIKRYIAPILLPFFTCTVLLTTIAAFREFKVESELILAVAKLMMSWLTVRLLSLVKMQLAFRRVLSFFIYATTCFAAIGLLPHLLEMMEHCAVSIGELHISLLSVLKGASLFAFLLWITLKAAKWIVKSLKSTSDLDPSHLELFSKLIKISFITFSVFFSLSASGLNLSAFAILGGAIGVGLGFGLQKVVANFICGIILLLDRSIKPGDVIALDQGKTYGEITELGARCVTVRTRAGKEHLIPNEEFITHRSENWSHSDRYLRLSLPIRVALNSDLELVLQLLMDAAEDVPRVLDKKKVPGVRVKGFSDSAIECELRVWICDPKNGVSKVRSDIYVNIWQLFKKHGVTIPHSQQDLHIHESSAHNLQQLLKQTKTH